MEQLINFIFTIKNSVLKLPCQIELNEKKLLDLIIELLIKGNTFELNFYCFNFFKLFKDNEFSINDEISSYTFSSWFQIYL